MDKNLELLIKKVKLDQVNGSSEEILQGLIFEKI